MTIAELHGKLSPNRPNGCNDRMEDLLTSDVFSAMKYAGWQCGFLDWLKSSIDPINNGLLADSLIFEDYLIEKIIYHFWPILKNGREPDLLLEIVCKDGEIDLIMIEAKYLSGPSDFELQSDNEASITGNQIADQINGFPDVWKRKSVRSKIHIYLTCHFICPKNIYLETLPHIKKKSVKYYWLNWQSLEPFLASIQFKSDEGKKHMLKDLCQLLRRKKLINFAGFQCKSSNFYLNLPATGFWREKWWDAELPSCPKNFNFWREK
jgi:hypothetical protein